MVDPSLFISTLLDNGFRFFTGVPDSLLKSVCACITDTLRPEQHVIAPNEGGSIGLAMGSYLATKSPAVVYMQNSGIGNAINPLISLSDPFVYSIPMLLLIGWRGEILEDGNQTSDEPQHRKQGLITTSLLDTMGIPYIILDSSTSDLNALAFDLYNSALRRSGPVALLIRKGTFSHYKIYDDIVQPFPLSREHSILTVLRNIGSNMPVVSTTGMISREVFELRDKYFNGTHHDFLTVGGMGHAIQIASGVALSRPDLRVVCLDGDGSLLMHSGSLSTSSLLPNIIHILLNNEAHDSVGGQPTRASDIKLTDVATAFGYSSSFLALTESDISSAITFAHSHTGSSFIEIKCLKGHRPDLGRPTASPLQNKFSFMSFLEQHV